MMPHCRRKYICCYGEAYKKIMRKLVVIMNSALLLLLFRISWVVAQPFQCECLFPVMLLMRYASSRHNVFGYDIFISITQQTW